MVANAALMGITAIVCGLALGHPLRDPDGFLGPAWMRLPLLCLGAFAADVLPRTLWRSRGNLGKFREEGLKVIRGHWTRDRIQLVVLGLVCFYVTYVSYRNIKNVLPFIRADKYDHMLHDLDHLLLFGNDPANLLHHLLGTGIAAHVLSFAYMFFLPMVPVSVAVWVVWSRNVSFGYWFATSTCMVWTLGTISYYIIPTLGPNFEFPWLYADIAHTGVSALQDALFYGRTNVRFDPFASGVQSVAGFASLHVGVTVMMALIAQYTVRNPYFRWALWIFAGITLFSTTYFGWHYIADDIAGLFIAWLAFYLGALATGQKFDRHGRSSHPTTTTDVVPVDVDER